VHPNIPFPGRPGSPQGKPGHFFGGPRRTHAPHPAVLADLRPARLALLGLHLGPAPEAAGRAPLSALHRGCARHCTDPQPPRNRTQSFLRIIRHPTGLKATYLVHPNIPFPGRPGSPQGKPGHFFLGASSAPFSPLSPVQPTHLRLLTTTARPMPSLRAPLPPEVGGPETAIALPHPFLFIPLGMVFNGGLLNPMTREFFKSFLTQAGKYDHSPVHKKSIPFPGNPGSP
jgi:hypothetical protein